jgi:uncharacterized protein YihD (DUF1040 family)
MRNPNRIKPLLKLIEEIWEKYPDLRLCQLIGNVAPYDNYHVEDDDLKNRLKEMYCAEIKKP